MQNPRAWQILRSERSWAGQEHGVREASKGAERCEGRRRAGQVHVYPASLAERSLHICLRAVGNLAYLLACSINATHAV